MFGQPRKLEAILSQFTSVLTELNDLQVYNQKVQDENQHKIDLLEVRNSLLASEAKTAKNVAERIGALLN